MTARAKVLTRGLSTSLVASRMQRERAESGMSMFRMIANLVT